MMNTIRRQKEKVVRQCRCHASSPRTKNKEKRKNGKKSTPARTCPSLSELHTKPNKQKKKRTPHLFLLCVCVGGWVLVPVLSTSSPTTLTLRLGALQTLSSRGDNGAWWVVYSFLLCVFFYFGVKRLLIFPIMANTSGSDMYFCIAPIPFA